ncbi:MAG: hypothetical protein QG604_334 [Candidatus Dependentiae bacterium]|nr:hypothetical protein [Candidatus Dependentiae bacterium]
MDMKLQYPTEQMEKMLIMLETAVTDYNKLLKAIPHELHATNNTLLYCRDAVVKRLEITPAHQNILFAQRPFNNLLVKARQISSLE